MYNPFMKNTGHVLPHTKVQSGSERFPLSVRVFKSDLNLLKLFANQVTHKYNSLYDLQILFV